MAIVKMKRLHMLALTSDRKELFDRLLKFGCLEVSEQSDKLEDPEWAGLVHRDESALEQQKAALDLVNSALTILNKYAPEKSGLFAIWPQITAENFFDDTICKKALDTAKQIARQEAALAAVNEEIQKQNLSLKSLVPWLSLDVPLGFQPTGSIYAAFGMIPASVDLEKVRQDLAQQAEAAELYEASTDTEVHYLFFLCHVAQKEEALSVLKGYGFSNTTFKGVTGTAQDAFDQGALKLTELEKQAQVIQDALGAFGESRSDLQLASDRLAQEVQKETCKERLLAIDQSFFLGGWVTAEKAPELEALLGEFDCAYELADPTEEEYPEVPVKLKNGIFTRCMNTVTEMYSLPAYDGIDPNPLMAPFFIIFYGMMMADMGYGILMILGCLFVLKKVQLKESMRNFFELFLWCGVATFIIGAMTGGFFGDFIPQLLKLIDPSSTFELPALFTPLNDTIAILIGSLVLGLIQIITGMAVSVWKKTKDGCFQDALWDEITWWIILVGAALAILGIGSIGGVPVVLIVGCLMLVYGGTRNAKGFGKVTALIGAVYNGISGFFSDTLSYLRLMALMLSGSVIASVFNTLGAAIGNVVVFIIISFVGNMLNMVLNLLGCYVHDLRLQCLEYFNRFYKDGGKAYKPLAIDTNYYNIIKEEK